MSLLSEMQCIKNVIPEMHDIVGIKKNVTTFFSHYYLWLVYIDDKYVIAEIGIFGRGSLTSSLVRARTSVEWMVQLYKKM